MTFWQSKRVMVTGGNGFLGKHLVRKLGERGADVFIVDVDGYDLRRLDDIRRALSDSKPADPWHGCGGLPQSRSRQGKCGDPPFDSAQGRLLPRASAVSARTANTPLSSSELALSLSKGQLDDTGTRCFAV